MSYKLPEERIARFPLADRDSSKLLVCDRGRISHQNFKDLASFLPENALLVFNDTRVVQARFIFRKATGAAIEVFCLEPNQSDLNISSLLQQAGSIKWKCLVGNLKRWKKEEILCKTIVIADGNISLEAELCGNEGNPRLVSFRWNSSHSFSEIMHIFGEMPIPPYLKREAGEEDVETYQTIYAKNEGAVAAPTAGLHFTEKVFESLERKGIERAFVTLHVSAGTFQPVKSRDFKDHPMHNEQMHFPLRLVEKLADSRADIICVGTTSLRALESLYWYGVKLQQNKDEEFYIEKLYPYRQNLPEISWKDSLSLVLKKMIKMRLDSLQGNTEIMIMPGYRFHFGSVLITNFHQPDSTLILLVSAFIGEDWKKVYDAALDNGYRFLSYGDSSLLIR